MSSRAGHVTTETVYGQTLALQLGDGDEHRPLESDTTGLSVKGKLNLYLKLLGPAAIASLHSYCIINPISYHSCLIRAFQNIVLYCFPFIKGKLLSWTGSWMGLFCECNSLFPEQKLEFKPKGVVVAHILLFCL